MLQIIYFILQGLDLHILSVDDELSITIILHMIMGLLSWTLRMTMVDTVHVIGCCS